MPTRILIVDDNVAISNLFAMVLKRLGCVTSVEKDSLVAFAHVEACPDDFDLIITDQSMPGLKGIELAERVSKIRPDLPIVLCTGFGDDLDKERMWRAGVKKLLLKPVRMSMLAELIEELGLKE